MPSSLWRGPAGRGEGYETWRRVMLSATLLVQARPLWRSGGGARNRVKSMFFPHILSGVLVFPEHPLLPTHLPLHLPYSTILFLPHTPYHTIVPTTHTIPYHTIPYHTIRTIPYHTIPWRTIAYHTISHQCHTVPYHTIPPVPYHTISYHTVPYHTYHTIPYHSIPKTILLTWCRAPPTPAGRPRLSEEGIGIPCYLHGFVPLPPLQGGPA